MFQRICAVGTVFVGLVAAMPAQAAVTLVTNRATLAGDDFIDWGSVALVPPLTPGPGIDVGNPVNVTTDGGIGVVVSKTTTGTFKRGDLGNPFGGNFAPADELLFNDQTTPMIFEFGVLLSGFGTQIMNNASLGPFIARIRAFDSGGASLGSFDVSGTTTLNPNNSAVFIGVRSDTPDIAKVELEIVSPTGGSFPGFFVNRVEIFGADSDGDTIPDKDDACPDSDLSPTVVIDGCDSGVANALSVLGATGCTITDLVDECAADAANHGEFVSCVAHLTNDLKDVGVIRGKEKGAIQSCAAKADIP